MEEGRGKREEVEPLRLRVRVTPGARRDEIVGWRGDALRVRVRVAPEKGKANEAVCALIAKAVGVAGRGVSVERGHASRDKVLVVVGIGEEEVMRRLGRPML
jgi:uncharacterized protein (TIGR00251 family)